MNDREQVNKAADPGPSDGPGQDVVRERYEAEIRQLREELEHLRSQALPGRDVDTVTDQLALQQEIDTLRRSLREKTRLVDVTAAQCSRLEDELEDQNLAYDGLKQDLERKKASLAAAREQTVRLSRERQELEERYHALLAGDPSLAALEQSAGETSHPAPDAPSSGFDKRFAMGLATGAVLSIAAAVVTLRPDLLPFASSPPPEVDIAANPVPPLQALPGAPEDPVSVEPTAEEKPVEEGDVIPEVVRTVRDRLRDGSFGPLMLAIREGHYTMGKLRALPNDDRGPARRVSLDGFLIGATEVTFEEYDRFARSTGRRFPNDFGWGRGRRPVVDVRWDDARDYTEWLTRQTGQPYRLPSEAEWEYVAAAGKRSPFWWGFEVEEGRAVCFDCGTLWDNRSSAPAGTFDPNPLGIYDTAGNAMEWTADCYHPNYVGAPSDGRPWVSEDCTYRVARGGAFNKPATSMGSTVRHRFAADTRLNMLGFRLARDE